MFIPKGQNATLAAFYEKTKLLSTKYNHFFQFLKKIAEYKIKSHGVLVRPLIAIKFFEYKGNYYTGFFHKNTLISTTVANKEKSYASLTANITRAAEMMDIGYEMGSIEIHFDLKIFMKIKDWYKAELKDWLIDGIDPTVLNIDTETKVEIVEAAKV